MPVAPAQWTLIGAAGAPAFSKDGASIFHLRGAGLPQVWTMDADGENGRPLSAHAEKVAFLRRSPADDRLVYGIDAGGDERQQFWTIPAGAENPSALTATPDVIHDWGAFSPDGERIAFAANDRDEAVFDVCVMALATGDRARVWEGPGMVSVSAWSPDGAHLAVIEDRASGDHSLWIIAVATGDARELPRPPGGAAGGAKTLARYASMRWTSDGTALMGLTDAGGSDFMRLCRIDLSTGVVEPVVELAGRDVEAWSLSPDLTLLATVENDRGYGTLRVGIAGTQREAVADLPGLVADLAWSPDSKRLAFTAQGPQTPPGIWLWDDASRHARPVWRPDPMAEAGIDPRTLIAPELVTWTSEDGRAVPGWFAVPRVEEPDAGYPAVIWVHGGPASQTRASWRPDIQMLLDQGYAVLMPNVRGSTGYGRAAMESDDVEHRPGAIADLAAARAWLAAEDGIDERRIGVMGQSYGGWMVLAAITLHPSLWKAAIDFYGIADFVTLLRHTSVWRRDHRAREYGFPGEHDDLFARISPIHHVAAVTAPLLVLHGDRDPRVPMSESDQIVAALDHLGKPVRYERFEYAGHGFIRPDHRARVYEAVAAHWREAL